MPIRLGSINRYILSNLSHRPVRALLSILAIAVEVTMILTLVGVSYGTLDATARRARGAGADIMIRPPGSSIIGLSSAPMTDLLVPMLKTAACRSGNGHGRPTPRGTGHNHRA